MDTEDQFSLLIKKENETGVIDMLRAMEPAERKKLAPLVKKLAKHYSDFKETHGSWRRVGSEKQCWLVQTAAFVCFTKAEYEKSIYAIWMLESARLSKVIGWYCPDWFGDYVNKLAGEEFLPPQLTYGYVMELHDKGYVQPSQSLIAKLLPREIYKNVVKDGKQQWSIHLETLHMRPATLMEHIWFLFDEETDIHYTDRYLYVQSQEEKKDFGWVPVFRKLAADGFIDRQRLLKESLLASNKNFNKVLSGWFVDLYESLESTTGEKLALQKELITVLNSPHSKPVTAALKELKKIAAEKTFDVDAFIDIAPVVLAGTTKSAVASCLMLIEQLASKRKELHGRVASLCSQAFIHADDELQTRAAKIIEKYVSKTDEDAIAVITTYKNSLLQNARSIVGPWLQPGIATEETINEAPSVHEVGNNIEAIPVTDTTDDLLFLASQAFDNNESFHIDTLPDALLRLQTELKGPVLAQLQPALQRALKLIKNNLVSTQGFYDHMLAVFFIDICVHLVRKFPAEAKSLKDVFEKYSQGDGVNQKKWLSIGNSTSYIASWTHYNKDPFYSPYKQLLIEALEKFRQGDQLPLLSTPTHRPGWVDAAVLVQRIFLYQQRNALAAPMDAQLAISRCHVTEPGDAVALAKEKLTGEWLQVILFLLGETEEPVGHITQAEAWIIASLSRPAKKTYAALDALGFYEDTFEKYTGQRQWYAVVEEYDRQEYDYTLRKTVTKKDTRKLLKFYSPSVQKKEEGKGKGVKGFFNRLWNSKVAPGPAPLTLYDYLTIKGNYFSNEGNDMRRAFSMIPNNPEPFLYEVTQRCLAQPGALGESDKKMIVATLQLLYELWDGYGEMAHLFLASAMQCGDKTAAGVAAEIWLRYTPMNKIDNQLLGTIMGKQLKVEFTPLKRLTDLIMQSMFRVSPAHNRMLQIIIENILPQLPETPIRNLKKLMEIYGEVKAAR